MKKTILLLLLLVFVIPLQAQRTNGGAAISLDAAPTPTQQYGLARNASMVAQRLNAVSQQATIVYNVSQTDVSGNCTSTENNGNCGTTTVQYTAIVNNPPSLAPGNKYYMRTSGGNPWGSTTNQQAMDAALGAGNWTEVFFETANVGTVFSGATNFVYMDGSDNGANALNTFLQANLPAIENWVSAGGKLLLNAGPNQGGNINFGFNGTTLVYSNFAGTVDVVAGHPALAGPLTPTSTTMTGNWWAHASITGTDLETIASDPGDGDVHLAEKGYGNGHIIVGGMTTTNWHSPQPNAFNFRANLIAYLEGLVTGCTPLVEQLTNFPTLPSNAYSLWDNGAGITRSLLDDFNVPAGTDQNVEEVSLVLTRSATPYVTPPSLEVQFRNDAGGTPGAVIATQVISGANLVDNGIVGNAFGRDFHDLTLVLTSPVTLPAGGTYWVEFQTGAPDNYFQERRNDGAPNGAQCWVDYSDLGGLQVGSNIFGVTADLVFTICSVDSLGEPPVIVCPADVTTDNDPGICGANVSFANAIAIDPEDGPIPTVQTQGPPSGAVFPVGDTIVEFTATDSDGNSSTCTFTVTVNDTEAPTITCQDITVELDANGMYSLTPSEVLAAATDNCAIDSMSFLVTPDPITSCAGDLPLLFDPPQQINSVTNVTDAGIVGVDYDIDNVSLNIQSGWANDITLTLIAPSGTTLDLSSGNGGINGLASPQDLVFTDASGNLVTGWTGGAPLADYQPEGGLLNSVFAGESITGNWTLNVFDVCCNDGGQLFSYCISFTPMSVAQATLDLTCDNIGPNNVEVMVIDEAGNSSTCTAVVTVEDNIAPEIMCIGEPGDVEYLEEFEGNSIPAGWTTVIEVGNWDWEFGSGNMPIGPDFPTNAAIFDDDAAGSGNVNVATLYSPVFDLSTSTTATLTYDVGLQVFIATNFTVEVFDGAAWQQIALYNTDLPAIITETFDVSSYINDMFQVRYRFDDLGNWEWAAGIDNFQLVYNVPSTPLVVELDENGNATINASDLVSGVTEACGYTVTTVGGTPVPGNLETLYGADNGGSNGGAIYFDVTIGPEDINLTDIDINTDEPGAFTLDVYTTPNTYVGNEGNAGAWTLVETGSGTASGTIDTPSNAVLGSAVTLLANTSYGIALVLDGSHGHSYTNGTGGNENYSNADLSLSAGAASNVPFDGSPFSPRVFNGSLNYLIGEAASTTIDFDCGDLGINLIDIQVTDASGNQAFCTASVEVVDVTDPILVCQDATIVLDENGMAEVTPEIFLANAPDTYEVMVIGSDNQSFLEGFTDFTVDVTEAAAISFDWDYVTNDDPGFDSFGYLLNGVYTPLTNPAVGNQNGSASVNVNPGDVFGFRSQTDDNILGNNETTISNFLPGFEGQFAPENWELTLTNSDGDAFFVTIPGGPLSYDNCGITVLAVDVTDVTCDDIGQTIIVTVFASDASGNLASCTATLTVVDETGPVIENCPEDMTVDPGPLNLFYEIPDYWGTGEITATDNCTDPVTDFGQDPAPGTLLPDGTYTITLTATDEYGNVSECQFELTIESTFGVDDNDLDSGIAIYPNPASHTVNIANATSQQIENVAIYDMNGRLVRNVKLGNSNVENSIDVSYLASGVYMLQIQSETAQTVKRLVKE